jgi:hypothetical protein
MNLQTRPFVAANPPSVLAVDLENFAAELTEAAFPVALRHGVGREWLELKLDLWNAMTNTVKNWSLSN